MEDEKKTQPGTKQEETTQQGAEQEVETICQCCAMPIQKEDEFGTNQDESLNKDYCCNCFQKGEFTFDMPFEEFSQRWVAIVTDKLGMPKEQAVAIAQQILPNLKRWKNKQ